MPVGVIAGSCHWQRRIDVGAALVPVTISVHRRRGPDIDHAADIPTPDRDGFIFADPALVPRRLLRFDWFGFRSFRGCRHAWLYRHLSRRPRPIRVPWPRGVSGACRVGACFTLLWSRLFPRATFLDPPDQKRRDDERE